MAGAQKKRISQYLSTRVQYWIYSLNHEEALVKTLNLEAVSEDSKKAAIEKFRKNVQHNTIVTGGAIASLLLGEEVNDIDIYVKDKEVARQLAWYYLNKMIIEGNLGKSIYVPKIDVKDNLTDGVAVFIKSMGVASEDLEDENYGYFESMSDNAIDEFFKEYDKNVGKEKPKHSVKFITSNAITLNNGVQIILRFCGQPEEIHKWYDFVHATNYWTLDGGLVYREEALQALLERRLKYVGSRFPVASLFRIRKFLRRGFHITAGEITKIAYDISKLDLDNKGVLHDQLIGVDYAYFSEVLSVLRKETDREIDRTYLFEILNDVFNDDEHELPEVEE